MQLLDYDSYIFFTYIQTFHCKGSKLPKFEKAITK